VELGAAAVLAVEADQAGDDRGAAVHQLAPTFDGEEVGRAAQVKLDEHGFRRRGLAVAAFFLVMLAGLLALKARRLEQARSARGA